MFYFEEIKKETSRKENLIPFVEQYKTYDIFSSIYKKKLKELPEFGRIAIQVGEVGRPDLLSFKLFNTVKYWEYLLEYNDIVSIEELREGVILKFFSISELQLFLSNLRVSSSRNVLPEERYIRKDKF